MIISLFLLILVCSQKERLDRQLNDILIDHQLMGLSVEITRFGQTIYKGNFGLRNYDRQLPIDNNTVFRMASMSKSITASGIMLLNISLTEDVSKFVGFSLKNPNFVDRPITLEMLLSHQSSLIDCQVLDSFINDTDRAKSGADIPNLQHFFTKGTKYYDECTFSNIHAPGTYFRYGALNYIIAGTVIERISGMRFDDFMREKILMKIDTNFDFNPSKISNVDNFAVLYEGKDGVWAPQCDNFQGKMKQRNLTEYRIGTNGAIFEPQAGVRASVSSMAKYINILREKGKSVLTSEMVKEMIRPRYVFRGLAYGTGANFNTYGLGLHTTGYRLKDNIWPHRVVVGHPGSSCGLLSMYMFQGEFAVVYAMNGALNGYSYNSERFYEVERQKIHNLTYEFIQRLPIA